MRKEIMKKKLTALLTLALTVTLLGGCGGTAKTTSGTVKSEAGDLPAEGSDVGDSLSGGEITVSDMINSILEEKGSVYIYEQVQNPPGKDFGKDVSVHVYKYDGSSLAEEKSGHKMGEYASGTESPESLEYETISSEVSLNLLTDSTGNNVRQETFYYKYISESNGNHYEHDDLKFGFTNFRHITIYDKSYMVFSVSNPERVWYECIAIEDTDYTKDKVIVFDKIGTDGITVDQGSDNSSFWNTITE